jgi:hypothetical protein
MGALLPAVHAKIKSAFRIALHMEAQKRNEKTKVKQE